METLLVTIVVFLGILCIIAFGILSNVSVSRKEIVALRDRLWDLRSNQRDLNEKSFEELKSILEDLKYEFQESKSALSDIQYIMNVIYKYKLPDKEEQELLDKIKYDNYRFGPKK